MEDRQPRLRQLTFCAVVELMIVGEMIVGEMIIVEVMMIVGEVISGDASRTWKTTQKSKK